MAQNDLLDLSFLLSRVSCNRIGWRLPHDVRLTSACLTSARLTSVRLTDARFTFVHSTLFDSRLIDAHPFQCRPRRRLSHVDCTLSFHRLFFFHSFIFFLCSRSFVKLNHRSLVSVTNTTELFSLYSSLIATLIVLYNSPLLPTTHSHCFFQNTYSKSLRPHFYTFKMADQVG